MGAFIHNLHASNVVPFGAVTYPQSLARCTGCHVDGKAYAARTSALPITVDAGTTLTNDAAALAWTDDLADSATAGTCKGCHTSAAEGCAFCHGPGQTFDTEKLHCATLPYGQCTQ